MTPIQTNLALGVILITIISVILLPLNDGRGYNLMTLDNIVTEYSRSRILKTKYVQALNLKSSGDKIVQDYNTVTDEDKNKILSAIPPVKDIPRRLNDIDKLCTKFNLVSEGLKISKNNSLKADRINYYDVSLTLTGDYKDFTNFLAELDKSLEIYNAKSVAVTNGKEGIGVDKLSYSLLLETFETKNN